MFDWISPVRGIWQTEELGSNSKFQRDLYRRRRGSTNAAGVAVRDFWGQYFNAAGATLEDTRYRALPPPANHDLWA